MIEKKNNQGWKFQNDLEVLSTGKYSVNPPMLTPSVSVISLARSCHLTSLLSLIGQISPMFRAKILRTELERKAMQS